jgi:hypothetical protein
MHQIASNTSNPEILKHIQCIYQQRNHLKLHFTDIDSKYRRKLREMSDIFSLVSDSDGGNSGFYFDQTLMEFTFPSSQKFGQRFKRCSCNCSISNVYHCHYSDKHNLKRCMYTLLLILHYNVNHLPTIPLSLCQSIAHYLEPVVLCNFPHSSQIQPFHQFEIDVSKKYQYSCFKRYLNRKQKYLPQELYHAILEVVLHIVQQPRNGMSVLHFVNQIESQFVK